MAIPRNMTQLRDAVLESFQDLRLGKIDISTAMATCKMADSVVGTVKAELDYCKQTKQIPQIAFINQGSLIEQDKKLLIENPLP